MVHLVRTVYRVHRPMFDVASFGVMLVMDIFVERYTSL